MKPGVTGGASGRALCRPGHGASPRRVCRGATRVRRQSGLLCRRRNHSHTSGRSAYHRHSADESSCPELCRTLRKALKKRVAWALVGRAHPLAGETGSAAAPAQLAPGVILTHPPLTCSLVIQRDLRRPGGANPELQQQPRPCPVLHSARPFVRTDISSHRSWARPSLLVRHRRDVP